MEELYIRKGNTLETRNILIIGKEKSLGSRDFSGYKPGKGQSFKPLFSADGFTGARDITYIHATPNICLNKKYPTDNAVHDWIKKFCVDILSWDGEASQGKVRSREAFIINGPDPDMVAYELYKRLLFEINGISYNPNSGYKEKFRASIIENFNKTEKQVLETQLYNDLKYSVKNKIKNEEAEIAKKNEEYWKRENIKAGKLALQIMFCFLGILFIASLF